MDHYSVLYFFILLSISALIHHFYKEKVHCEFAAGSIVMAIGISIFDVLPQFHCVTHFIRQLIVLELLVIWLYLACFFVRSFLQRRLNIFTANAINQFGIGTWVAGSAVLAVLFFREFPSWYCVIWICSFCALAIWPIYLFLSGINLWHIFFKKIKVHTGTILLLTVSTQSIVLLIHTLFAGSVPMLLSLTLILLGYVFYIIGIAIIGKYLMAHQWKYLFLGWRNGNSIIHGALSISGLASILTHSIHDKVIFGTWILASGLFFLVEGMSLIKMYYRIKIEGFLDGIFVYNLSQWTRLFTFGMYYSFTLALSKQNVFSNFIMNHVVSYGKYVVLVLLLFETFIFLHDNLSIKASKHNG